MSNDSLKPRQNKKGQTFVVMLFFTCIFFAAGSWLKFKVKKQHPKNERYNKYSTLLILSELYNKIHTSHFVYFFIFSNWWYFSWYFKKIVIHSRSWNECRSCLDNVCLIKIRSKHSWVVLHYCQCLLRIFMRQTLHGRALSKLESWQTFIIFPPHH